MIGLLFWPLFYTVYFLASKQDFLSNKFHFNILAWISCLFTFYSAVCLPFSTVCIPFSTVCLHYVSCLFTQCIFCFKMPQNSKLVILCTCGFRPSGETSFRSKKLCKIEAIFIFSCKKMRNIWIFAPKLIRNCHFMVVFGAILRQKSRFLA